MESQVPTSLWTKLALMIAFYYGGDKLKKYLKIGILGYLGYQIYLYKSGKIDNIQTIAGPMSGAKIHIDTDMALDMFMPDMSPHGRQITKLAMNQIMKGLNS